MTSARRKRVILFVLVLGFIVCLILTTIPVNTNQWMDKRLCYLPPPLGESTAQSEDENEFLPFIGKDPLDPTPRQSIFFHETSCSVDSELFLNARQACAIESAAKTNPDRDVYVLFTSPRKRSIPGSSAHLEALSQYKNIILRNVDLWEYSRGTLIEDWIHDNVLFTSEYVNFHLSDFMRFLSLNKYRGTYLDMDIIVLRRFNADDSNFAGAESAEDVAAGIISLSDTQLGRQVSEMCLRDFRNHFSGSKWGNNGPGVITRVLERICSTSNTTKMTAERCHGFKVLSPEFCYAIPYRKWELFFEVEKANEVLGMLNNSLIAHFWNKFSITRNVKVGDGSAYDLLAKKFCPLVYGSVGEYF